MKLLLCSELARTLMGTPDQRHALAPRAQLFRCNRCGPYPRPALPASRPSHWQLPVDRHACSIDSSAFTLLFVSTVTARLARRSHPDGHWWTEGGSRWRGAGLYSNVTPKPWEDAMSACAQPCVCRASPWRIIAKCCVSQPPGATDCALWTSDYPVGCLKSSRTCRRLTSSSVSNFAGLSVGRRYLWWRRGPADETVRSLSGTLSAGPVGR